MKRLLLSILITFGIIFVLFTQISLGDLYFLIKKMDLLWALLGAGGYLLALFFRALRYKWLIHSKDVPLSQLFKISAFYNLSLMVLPSKLGELSYPYFLNKICGMSITEGFASLLASRVYDFFTILTIFIFTLIGLQGSLEINLIFIILLSVLAVFLILVVFFYMSNFLRFFSNILGKISKRTKSTNSKSFQWGQRNILEMAEDFSAIKARRAYLPITLTSLASWMMALWMFFAFVRGFGVEISFLKVVFASTIAVITNALPISALGNWGILEAGWTAGFMVVGLSKGKAIATAFGFHILIFIISVIISFICWVPSLSLPYLYQKGQEGKK